MHSANYSFFTNLAAQELFTYIKKGSKPSQSFLSIFTFQVTRSLLSHLQSGHGIICTRLCDFTLFQRYLWLRISDQLLKCSLSKLLLLWHNLCSLCILSCQSTDSSFCLRIHSVNFSAQMQSTQTAQTSENIHMFYHQPLKQFDSFQISPFQILNSNSTDSGGSHGTQVTFSSEQFFTLESLPATDHSVSASPSGVSFSSSRSPFSSQSSQSYMSEIHHSSDNNYSSPLSGSSCADDGSDFQHALREIEMKLLGPDPDFDDSSSCSFNSVVPQPAVSARSIQLLEMAPHMDIKQLLISCAEAIDNLDISTAEALMNVLEPRVSVSGEPIQRLGAYMLEGLRARRFSSGSIIYKKLKCKEPTGPELMSFMSVLYQICPYYKFAYMASNVMIREAMETESRIHIIDFTIAQGSQWMSLLQDFARRPGGPPFVRITGVDDSQSVIARGGGMDIVGQKLAQVAKSCGVPFEFHGAAISGSLVHEESLQLREGEAIAVNFPYMLHHMPDESVNTMNHRDRLLRLVKSLSPKIVTLVEQESNTNTAPFFPRFCETLDYYTAMFESIDAGRPRDDKQRISAEEHCVARDIVNIVACEGADRVERHELFGKWRMRLSMAGFIPVPLSLSVSGTIRDMLKEYSTNYRYVEKSDGAIYLGWKNRALATCSAWR